MFNYDRMVARARNLVGRMQKKADGGIVNDALDGAVTGYVPIAGPLANLGGAITGIVKGKPTEEEQEEMDRRPAMNCVPGVGAYRTWCKSLDAVQNDRLLTTALSETRAMLLHSLIGTSVGEAIGWASSGQEGVGIGAMAGSADTWFHHRLYAQAVYRQGARGGERQPEHR